MTKNSSSTILANLSVIQNIIDNLSEGVAIADKDGKLIYFNKNAERILGLGLMEISPEEWAKAYGAYLPDKETPFPVEQYPLVRALKGEETHNVEQYIKNPKNKTGIFISISGSPIKDDKGTIIGSVVIFEDITQRKQSEEEISRDFSQLQEMNQMMMSRELKMKQLKKELEALKDKCG